MKKLFVLIITALMFSMSLFGTVKAQDEEVIQGFYVNPVYRDVFETNTYTQVFYSTGDENVQYQYVADLKQASELLKQAMLKRSDKVSVEFDAALVSDNDISGFLADMFLGAFYETDKCNEGDYLRYSTYGYGYSGYFGGNRYGITFEFSYFDNYEEELVLEKEINNVLNQLNVYEAANFEKIKAVYGYICDNIVYDYEHLPLHEDYLPMFSAYAGLINKTCVCQGYATLLYRMLKLLNVDVRVITGLGNGGAHAWNIVKTGNYWYNVDSTWDAGYSYPYYYFMKNNPNFTGHSRYSEYNGASFTDLHIMSATDYDFSIADDINHQHVYLCYVYNNDATCNSDGTETAVCEYCDVENTRVLAGSKLNHQPVTSKAKVEATCTSEGYSEETRCKYCGIILQESTVIAKKQHTAVIDKAVSPTCTSDGKTEGSHCSLCGTVIKGQEVVKAMGHKAVIDGAVKPTCTATGKTEGSHCSVCGYVIKGQNTLAPTGHSFTEYSENTTLTTWVNKAVYRKCSVCGLVENTGKNLNKPLTITRSSDTALKIKWDKCAGAKGYYIYRATSPNGKYSKVATITKASTTSYTNKKLKSGTTYYYKVVAYNSAKKTIATSPVTGYAALKKPSSFTYKSVSPTVVDITYKKPAGAAGVELYYSTSKSGTYTLLANDLTTSCRVTNMTTNKAYYFKMRAYKYVDGQKVYGPFTAVLTGKATVGKPTVTLTAKSKAMSVKIKAVNGVTGYEIYRSSAKSKGYKKIADTTTLVYSDTGLKGAKTYYYKVRAYYIDGNGTKYYGPYSKVIYKKTAK